MSNLSTQKTWRSKLYGASWTPLPSRAFDSQELIQDFSYAGYHRGEKRIPDELGPICAVPATEGSVDSTRAIQDAIDDAEKRGGGVVLLAEGTYRVAPPAGKKQALLVKSSNIVIRGAGTTRTFLVNTSTNMRHQSVIAFRGNNPSWYWDNPPSFEIADDLLSPTTTVPVKAEGPPKLKKGDWIVIRVDPTDAWIEEHGEKDGWIAKKKEGVEDPNQQQKTDNQAWKKRLGGIAYCRQIVDIELAGDRHLLKIDAPTRYSLKRRDNARVFIRNNAIEEFGLEDLSIGNVEHPGNGWGSGDYTKREKSAYQAHQSYLVRVSNGRNGWIRNVNSFQHRDNTTTSHMLSNGIRLSGCRGVTLADCHMQRPQYGGGGGNGYMFGFHNANECLATDCQAELNRHGFVFSKMGSSGNVIHDCLDKDTNRQMAPPTETSTKTKGQGYKAGASSSDHHMHFSHSNLIDVCRVDNSWFSATYRPNGSSPKHNLTAAHTVFWNTEGSASSRGYVVHSQQGRFGYVIGTRGDVTAVKIDKTVRRSGSGPSDRTKRNRSGGLDHYEGIGEGESLDPRSLYIDQRRRRLSLPSVDNWLDLSRQVGDEITLNPKIVFGDSTTIPLDGSVQWKQICVPSDVHVDLSVSRAPTITLSHEGFYAFVCIAKNQAYDIREAQVGGLVEITVVAATST